MSGLSGTHDGFNASHLDSFHVATESVNGEQFQLLSPIRDTTSVSEAIPSFPKNIYSASTNRPELSPPLPGDHGDNGAMVMHVLKSYPDQMLMALGSLPKFEEDKFGDDVERLLNEVEEVKFAAIGNGDPAKGKQKVLFAILHPKSKFPPEVTALANKIRESAEQSSGSQVNETVTGLVDATYQKGAEVIVESNILATKFSPEQQNQLRFAYNVPEAASSLSPELQTALKEIIASSTAEAEANFGTPEGWISPPDAKETLEQIGSRVESKVSNELSRLLADGKISKAQYDELRTLLYISGAQTPNKEVLEPMLTEMVQTATNELQSDYGFPNNFKASIEGKGFQRILAGSYFTEFNHQLKLKSSSLSSSEISALKQALISPEAASELPAQLKKVFNETNELTIKAVSKKYGLPQDWTPEVEMMATYSKKSTSPNIKTAQTMLNQLKEWAHQTNRILTEIGNKPWQMDESLGSEGFFSSGIETIRDINTVYRENAALEGDLNDIGNQFDIGTDKSLQIGEDAFKAVGGGTHESGKVLISNYMTGVQSALATAQEMLYELSIADSNISTKLNQIQNDAQLANLEKQRKQIQETLDKMKKMASLGPLKAIIQCIIMILLVVMMGPLGIALIVNAFAQNATSKNGFDMGKMDVFGALAETMSELGDAIGGTGGKFVAAIMKLLSLLVLVMLNPMCMIICLLVDLTFGNASMVKLALEGFGIPPKVAQYIAMAVQIVFQIVAMVALAIFTGGSSIEVGILKITETIGRVCIQALEVFKEVATVVYQALAYIARAIALVLSKVGIVFPSFSAMTIMGTGATTSSAQTTAQVLYQALKTALKEFVAKAETAIENIQKAEAAVNAATEGLQAAKTAEANAHSALNLATASGNASPELLAQLNTNMTAALKNVAAAETALTEAVATYKAALEVPQRIFTALKTITTSQPQIIQQSVNLNNSVLKAKIARIKGEAEAYKIEVNQFVAAMKSTNSKIIESMKSISGLVKSIGDQISATFTGASQAIAAMSQI